MNRRGMLRGLCGLIPGLAMFGLARRTEASTVTSKPVARRENAFNTHLDGIRVDLIHNLRFLADGLEAESGQVVGFGGLGTNSAQPIQRNGRHYGFYANGSRFCIELWRLDR